MNLYAVILAAGEGKRMKSDRPKVLHNVVGIPMLHHVIEAVQPLKPARTIVVIGKGADIVKTETGEYGVTFVTQQRLLGTGDALSTAGRMIGKGTIIVLNGDCPLITTSTLRSLLRKHKRNRNALSFLTFRDPKLQGYGRIIRDEKNRVTRIVEDKHATAEERRTFTELNGGVYAIEADLLPLLKKIRRNRSSGEYYLTDLVSLVAGKGWNIDGYDSPAGEIHGVNNRAELFKVSDMMRHRTINYWMQRGVTFLDPASCIIHKQAVIGKDTVIYPGTFIEGPSRIGKECMIFPGARIVASRIGSRVTVKDCTLIENSVVKDDASVGPFAHIRPQSIIGRRAKIGNFVETKKSVIGDGTKASHLSYIGDALIGDDVNIGAGTITCNYDGKNKFRTKIASGVFIGSDTQLVAPVSVGRGAFIAAGSTVTRNVPPGSLAISRVSQENIRGWAKKKKSVSSDKKS
jgi:bifunctional UDP-N-acetylglucosamine pyrophosphorylase/glucosamine-1-phosphate N-acetyltransferase